MARGCIKRPWSWSLALTLVASALQNEGCGHCSLVGPPPPSAAHNGIQEPEYSCNVYARNRRWNPASFNQMPDFLRLRGGERERKRETARGRKRDETLGDLERTALRGMGENDSAEPEETSTGRTRIAKKAARKSLRTRFVSGGSRGGDDERSQRHSREGKKDEGEEDIMMGGVEDAEEKKLRKSLRKERDKKPKQQAKEKPQNEDTDKDDRRHPQLSSPADANTGTPAGADENKQEDGSISEGDEYLDYFKYRLKWSFDREEIIREEKPLVPSNAMPPQLREIARLVLPVVGTEPFHEKLARDWIVGTAPDGSPIFRAGMPKGFDLNEDLIANPDVPSTRDLWRMTPEQLMRIDADSAPTVQKAKQRADRNATAGPDWGFLPRAPDIKARPDLRAALKLLSRRQDWDPKARFKSIGWEKKGGSTKSPFKISYPKYFQEGVVALDPLHPRENLDKAMRKMNLAQQIMADPAIQHHLQRRFKKKMTIAGGWHPRKGERLEWEVQKREKKIKLRAPKESSRAHRDARSELRRAKAYNKHALGITTDPISKRVLPKMPSQGGTGKSPEQLRKEWEAGAEERMKRARKKREAKEKRKKAKGSNRKRKVDKAKSRIIGKIKRLKS